MLAGPSALVTPAKGLRLHVMAVLPRACSSYKAFSAARSAPIRRSRPAATCYLTVSLSFAPRLKHHVATRQRNMSVMAAAAPVSGGAKRVLVPVGEGTEEMEAVIIIDVLRRAGAAVTVASVEPDVQVTCSRGVRLVADALIGDVAGDTYDLVACPGGMPGAERLRESGPLGEVVQRQAASGRLLAAICATPAVFFAHAGLLEGRRATAHPAFSSQLPDQSVVAERVVVDGTLTTSRGPGTAFEFALSLVKQLYGEDKMKEVAGPMVMYQHGPL